MESRRLLAIVVGTYSDTVDPNDGVLSLREAIVAAADNAGDDVIQLPAGSYHVSSQLDINDSSGAVSIESIGGQATLQGNLTHRLMSVGADNHVAFTGLRITGGRATLGGAIQAASGSVISITNSSVSNNMADQKGGAIYLQSASLSISASTLDANWSAQVGGAIYVDGQSDVSISDGSTLSNNSAWYDGGAIFNRASQLNVNNTTFLKNLVYQITGGAISNREGSTTSVADSWFLQNKAADAGGAIHTLDSQIQIDGSHFIGNIATNAGGALFSWNSSTSVSQVQLQNNSAKFGGAAYIGGGSLTVLDSQLDQNKATGTVYAAGGGLELSNHAQVVIAGTTLTKNTSQNIGGAIHLDASSVTIDNSTLDSNSSASAGGGIDARGGSVIAITASSLTNNSTVYAGGAIFNGSSQLSISDSHLEKNKVSLGTGGALSNLGHAHASIVGSVLAENSSNSLGGAVISDLSQLEIRDSEIRDNSTFSSGAAILAQHASEVVISGSTISGNHGGGSGSAVYNDASSVTIQDSTVTGNWTGNTGGAIFAQNGATTAIHNTELSNNTTYHGGGAIDSSASQLTIDNSRFSHNAAWNGPGGAIRSRDGAHASIVDSVFEENQAIGDGAAILSDASQLQLEGSQFHNNPGANGAVTLLNNATTVIKGSDFANNPSRAVWNANSDLQVLDSLFDANTGGALASLHGQLLLQDSQLTNNSAPSEGGALYLVSGSTSTVLRTQFMANSAHSSGGAIYNLGSDLTVEDSHFESNTADTYLGGAISIEGASIVAIANSDFLYNNAGYFGGAIYNAGFDLTISGGTFESNSSARSGGAIFNKTTLQINNVHFAANVAGTDGGAIYGDGGQIFVTDSIFSGNHAAKGTGLGSALYISSRCTLEIDADTVVSNNGKEIYYESL